MNVRLGEQDILCQIIGGAEPTITTPLTKSLHQSNMIFLFKFSAEELELDTPKSPFEKQIKTYLFGTLRTSTAQASDYINAVNIIYALIRNKLSTKAHNGELSAKQTIAAKRIIHNLNKESVQSMVEILKLNDTEIPPDELIILIKQKRTDGSISINTELEIKEVVYFKKLFAVKKLILLLHMEKEDIQIPVSAPRDLIDVIFTPEITFELDDFNTLEPEVMENGRKMEKLTENHEFFNMACFHDSYLKWKRENNIQDDCSCPKN